MRRGIARGHIQIPADLAAVRHLPIAHGQRARKVEQIAGPHRGEVIARGCGRRRQRKTKFL